MSELNGFFINSFFAVIADADANNESIEISTEEDLSKLARENILSIKKSVFGQVTPLDGKKTGKTLAKEIFAELNKSETSPGASSDKPPVDDKDKPKVDDKDKPPVDDKDKPPVDPPKEKKETKAQILRRVLAAAGSMSQKDLAAAVGSDIRNTHTMVAILGNEKRTKEPVKIAYDKATKTYTWPA